MRPTMRESLRVSRGIPATQPCSKEENWTWELEEPDAAIADPARRAKAAAKVARARWVAPLKALGAGE